MNLIPLVPPEDGLNKRGQGDERIRTAASALTTERQKGPHPGCIYVIQAESGGPVKIGYCAHEAAVRSRLKSLQTGNPLKLRIVQVEAGTPEDERDLHREFRDYRLCGEWFQPSLILAMRFPSILAMHEDVNERTRLYDLGFQNGWERGYDDAAECDECGERHCECPDTDASNLRQARIERHLTEQWYEALHGSARRIGGAA